METICTCGRLAVDLTVSDIRNWRADCPAHGVNSPWYRAPSQVAHRAAFDARLREMYEQARAAAREAQRERAAAHRRIQS
jgi:hypothetical protein